MVALVRRDFTSFVRYNPIAPLATALMVAYALWALRSLLAVGTLARVGEGRAGRVLLMATLGVAALEFVLWIARFAGFFGGPVPV